MCIITVWEYIYIYYILKITAVCYFIYIICTHTCIANTATLPHLLWTGAAQRIIYNIIYYIGTPIVKIRNPVSPKKKNKNNNKTVCLVICYPNVETLFNANELSSWPCRSLGPTFLRLHIFRYKTSIYIYNIRLPLCALVYIHTVHPYKYYISYCVPRCLIYLGINIIYTPIRYVCIR